MHTDLVQILFVLWYRSPSDSDPFAAIAEFETDFIRLSHGTIGTVVVGDLNIHHTRWLKCSNANTPEGTRLMRFCHLHNLSQMVKHPTRGEYLLDLVLTDLPQLITTAVTAPITDHNIVMCKWTLKSRNLSTLLGIAGISTEPTGTH